MLAGLVLLLRAERRPADEQARSKPNLGRRSPNNIIRTDPLPRSGHARRQTHEIDGAGHAAPFDATSNFAELLAGTITAEHPSGVQVISRKTRSVD